MDMKVKR